MSDLQPTRAKLPLWASVNEAYRLTWNKLPGVLGPLAIWLLLTAFGVAAIEWALWVAPLAEGSEAEPDPYKWLIAPVFALLTGAAVAVPWHRLLLKHDDPDAGSLIAITDSRVWRYFMWGVIGLLPLVALIFAIWYGFAFTSTAPIESSADPAVVEATGPEGSWSFDEIALAVAATVFFGIPVFALLSFIQLRFSMMLPAVAIEDSTVTPRQAWAVSAGNFWRLFWGTGFTFGPFMVASLIWSVLLTDGATRLQYAAVSAADYAFLLLGGMVSVAFLSVAFRHFFPDAAAQRTE